MRVGIRGGVLCAAMALTACGAGVDQAGNTDGEDLPPTGKGAITLQQLASVAEAGNAKPVRGNGITYHGGPVILGTTNVHYIWYGNWSSSDKSILTTLAQGIGGSPYFNINTTYYNGSSQHVLNVVNLVNSTTDNYSQGNALSDAGVQAVVSSAISSGRLPKDSNGVYFVLTSSDVNETSGFCTQYCGWHTHGTIGGREVIAIFQRLNQERGITIILVTHEPAIAAHTQRIIHIRDGRIYADERVAKPKDAAHELTVYDTNGGK